MYVAHVYATRIKVDDEGSWLGVCVRLIKDKH